MEDALGALRVGGFFGTGTGFYGYFDRSLLAAPWLQPSALETACLARDPNGEARKLAHGRNLINPRPEAEGTAA